MAKEKTLHSQEKSNKNAIINGPWQMVDGDDGGNGDGNDNGDDDGNDNGNDGDGIVNSNGDGDCNGSIYNNTKQWWNCHNKHQHKINPL